MKNAQSAVPNPLRCRYILLIVYIDPAAVPPFASRPPCLGTRLTPWPGAAEGEMAVSDETKAIAEAKKK